MEPTPPQSAPASHKTSRFTPEDIGEMWALFGLQVDKRIDERVASIKEELETTTHILTEEVDYWHEKAQAFESENGHVEVEVEALMIEVGTLSFEAESQRTRADEAELEVQRTKVEAEWAIREVDVEAEWREDHLRSTADDLDDVNSALRIIADERQTEKHNFLITIGELNDRILSLEQRAKEEGAALNDRAEGAERRCRELESVNEEEKWEILRFVEATERRYRELYSKSEAETSKNRRSISALNDRAEAAERRCGELESESEEEKRKNRKLEQQIEWLKERGGWSGGASGGYASSRFSLGNLFLQEPSILREKTV
ncbi:hypothetical protein BDN72DRAFT_957656, partial [Pluteus cervinus]